MRQEGIFKLLNGAMEKINHEQFIIQESWRKQRARFQQEHPTARIKYSYKTKQFTIIYGLPSDFKIIKFGWNLPD